jgi:protein-disulfide isomerase
MFTDYQCPDCKGIEAQAEALLREGLGMSLSVKQFPLSTACNPHAPGDLHPNACWAARAAEAAGMVGGPEAFWRMHRWLVARGGSFTDEEITAALPGLGLEPRAFFGNMHSQDVNAMIAGDIAEGMGLGIERTPMVFINGVELKGWQAPDALTRAVRALAATNPAPGLGDEDRPPTAAERSLAAWREAPARTLPPEVFRHALGPADSPITVVVWGDYGERFVNECDALLRVFATGPEPARNIRYCFVHYPVDPACNPASQVSRGATSCDAAFAAESADALGGPEAFWTVHAYLMERQHNLTEQVFREAFAAAGIDAETGLEGMRQPFVRERVAADGRLGAAQGLTSIPMIFVNGKHLAAWKVEHENVLGRVFAELWERR